MPGEYCEGSCCTKEERVSHLARSVHSIRSRSAGRIRQTGHRPTRGCSRAAHGGGHLDLGVSAIQAYTDFKYNRTIRQQNKKPPRFQKQTRLRGKEGKGAVEGHFAAAGDDPVAAEEDLLMACQGRLLRLGLKLSWDN